MITIEEILNKRTPLNDKVFLHYDLMNKKAILFIKDHGWEDDTIYEVYRKVIISYVYRTYYNKETLVTIAQTCLQLMCDNILDTHDSIDKNFTRSIIAKESYPWNFLRDLGIKIEDCFDTKNNISDELTEIITKNLKLLPKEVQCIKLRYIDMNTIEDIGKNIGVTRERARQIISKAIYKIINRPSRIGLVRRLLWSNSPDQGKFVLTNLLNGEKNIYDVLNLTMEDLLDYFSVRTYNCLKRAGINTVRNIVSMTEYDLKSIRNLGERTFNEIVSVIEDMGLHLGTNYDGEDDDDEEE